MPSLPARDGPSGAAVRRTINMKIAQIAPLYESVPPRLYGGTERVVAHLCDALVDEGHDVTLFAAADARTKAHLVRASAAANNVRSEEHTSELQSRPYLLCRLLLVKKRPSLAPR